MPRSDSAELQDHYERATGEILARVCAFAPRTSPVLAVACSGGLDSIVLLHLAQAHAARAGLQLFAFHIHHGLSPHADAWQKHCAEQCAALGVPFSARSVQLQDRGGRGVEEAARLARYAALGELCREHGVHVLLTAHHQDDQAETVLLQLLRGSGVAGLGGMDAFNTAPGLLGDAQLHIARPLLDVSRADLEAYAGARAIAHVEDESNADARYARNALRINVMPALDAAFPGFAGRIARSAGHMRAAQDVLDAVAGEDLQACLAGDCLDLERLRRLPDARIDNLLRHWFAQRQVRLPSTAWLHELRSQLLEAHENAQPCIEHPDCTVRRHRQRAFLLARSAEEAPQPQRFTWQDEAALDFPAFGGRLLFEAAPEGQGADAEWLVKQSLILRHRACGERLKIAPNRPTRSLKQHCQTLDIPPWEREAMVFVAAGGDVLLASGIGADCRHAGPPGSRGILLRWEAKSQ